MAPKKVKAEKVLDLSNPIVQVVLPLKKDAAERAKQYAEDEVAALRGQLKDAGWDATKVAPYPTSSGYGGFKYFTELERHNFLNKVTEWDYVKQPGGRGFNEPCIVKMSSARIAKYIATCVKEAELQYDMFVMKLTDKIGMTKTASLDGNHVWLTSILTVELPSGETQQWFTQQIYNVSKLGKQFPQWPTRKLKA
jgi:hypothetical protein